MFPKEQYQERPFPCTGRISYTGHASLQRDVDNLKAAVASSKANAGFLPVVAPASATALSPNQYYKTDEEWLPFAYLHCVGQKGTGRKSLARA